MSEIEDLFPDHPRTLYTQNPLVEVVCQIRFPTILRIEAHPPSELQERIREQFPLLERTTSAIAKQIPQELLKAIGAPPGGSGYAFGTADDHTTANLMSDSFTISTDEYVRWEEFWGLARQCFSALIDIYSPNFFTRLGLRYQNVIRRSDVGMENANWSDLLNRTILGELASEHWEATATEARRVIRCKGAADGDAVLLQHGTAEIEGQDEQCYLVDFDFYRDSRVEVDGFDPIFERFNRRSGRAFRWAITDRLHEALEPREI